MTFIPKYIFILAITITIDYFTGLGLEKFSGTKRKWLLAVSILSNIGMLAFFKYFNFVTENIASLANFIGWNYPIHTLEIILPIGLSFHTFQSLSYTIEVYRGRQKPERHFGYLATYVMFYPQLVAGPIERPQNVLHQLHTEQKFEYQRVTDGLKWMAWGMFKKVVIADRMALIVDPVFNSPASHNGPAFLFATLAFAIQIYCDFSGYSDIALGSAQVMGIKLMKNFDHPYFSKSISEFWQRWHISLSTWFRDYLYIPLGGNRVTMPHWAFNLFITFLISGLWHGASWTYVIWGALHGAFVIISNIGEKLRGQLSIFSRTDNFQKTFNVFSSITTFSLVTFAWIFFRANNVTDAFYIARGLFHGWDSSITQFNRTLFEGMKLGGLDAILNSFFNGISTLTSEPRSFILITTIALVIFLFVEINQFKGNFLQRINLQPNYIRLVLYTVFITITLLFGTTYTGAQRPFIYFQF